MRAILALSFVVTACQGVGAPIVGEVPIPEGSCELSPRCRPIRSFDASSFEVPEILLGSRGDCDGDRIPDELDMCPADAVGGDVCAAPRAACDRLIAGETSFRAADLRGCIAEITDPAGDLDLSGADLGCASIRIAYTDEAIARTLDLSAATLDGATLDIGAAGPLAITADDAALGGAVLRLSGRARLRAERAMLDDALVVTAPSGTPDVVAPAIELVASEVRTSAIVEERGVSPGRVRIAQSTVEHSTIVAQVLELAESALTVTHIDAREVHVLFARLHLGAVRTDYGLFAAASIDDVVFDRCVDLSFSSCELTNVDIPACEPERLRIVESGVIGAAIGGGAVVIESSIEASVITGGEGSVLHTDGAVLDGVGFCDVRAAAFIDSELRCVHCGDGAFPDGVCIDGEITQRGCPAIELAPSCP